ncbi:phenylacetate-CoA ligase [Methanococcus voltae PS]|uniref:Phenylacetate-CoA ligase n=1 Tax=Methanococcus voltae PS TaxID=523842 RepID=A0ABT2EWS0_METVO|nr:phenylacetate--CoA ligase [Methanococcus voltae]MCS3922402.1 phenylacetate-CoA ligase [Methanococcus voltae PS]
MSNKNIDNNGNKDKNKNKNKNHKKIDLLIDLVKRAKKGTFYKEKLKDIEVSEIKTLEDIQKLPFTTKSELRKAYPLGLSAVGEEEIVRIHSTSGTTGEPVIIPYTKKDVEVFTDMMSRCYEVAGVISTDRVHITPGYGLWTAGIGFQLGAEKMGAMTIPMGPGNTEKQLKMMVDLKSTVLTSTSSYALLLAEEIHKRGISDKICLRKGIIGSERWSEKMRNRIEKELNMETYDIYGLTEVYGPGIAIDCDEHDGLHYWNDYLLFEIIDPITGKVLPDGTIGELVITTLVKEGAPLIRYRTGDLTQIMTGKCSCGAKYPKISRILGRSDDRIKIKGVNIFPQQIEKVIECLDELCSEYQVVLTKNEGRDNMLLRVELKKELIIDSKALLKLEQEVQKKFKNFIGIKIDVECVNSGELPRSEKKSKRIIDKRL